MRKSVAFLLTITLLCGLFLMPAEKVDAVTFNGFADVGTDNWYYDSVKFVFDNGYMVGEGYRNGKVVFNPSGTMTRAMVAMVLWRMNGLADPGEPCEFEDVKRDAWYAEAADWARNNDLFYGDPGGRFHPDDPITREEMCAVFLRYAESHDIDVYGHLNLEIYRDGGEVQEFAREGVARMFGNCIIGFKTVPGAALIDPKGSISRGEFSKCLMRLFHRTEPIDMGTYADDTVKIHVTREWFANAIVYAAHLEFTDYSRFYTDCANGAYDNGSETTSHAAKRNKAVFAVNGCWSAPCLDYTVIRHGKVWNGGSRNMNLPATYSSTDGKLRCGGEAPVYGKNVNELVKMGAVTDSFCFGPPILRDGKPIPKYCNDGAQRTFIGTNGNPGDIWIIVSEGRWRDNASFGLCSRDCADLLLSKGCTFGVPLDGGGSSTMYFKGKVLNSAAGQERQVVDFVLVR